MDVHQQCIACRVDVVVNGIAGDGNVFRARSGARRFAEINWFAWPKDVFCALCNLVDVGTKTFVVAHRNAFLEIFVGMDLIKTVVFPELRISTFTDQFVKHIALGFERAHAPFLHLRCNQRCNRLCQY